jgi:hypothetical protein
MNTKIKNVKVSEMLKDLGEAGTIKFTVVVALRWMIKAVQTCWSYSQKQLRRYVSKVGYPWDPKSLYNQRHPLVKEHVL